MRKTFLVLLLLHYAFLGISQNSRPQQLSFHHLGIKEGLPGNMVGEVYQDKEGYIWISTSSGLVRYDGYALKRYNLEGKYIVSIYEDKQKTLWMATDQALFYYQRNRDEFAKYSLPQKYANKHPVTGMLDAGNNHLYLDLDDIQKKVSYTGLLDVQSHHLTIINGSETNWYHDALIQKPNASKVIDKKGRLWIEANKGLLEYDPVSRGFTTHYLYNSTSQRHPSGLTIDSLHPEFIWFYVFDEKLNAYEGIGRYNTANNTVKMYRHQPGVLTSIRSDTCHPLGTDSQHRLWFGTSYGLSVYNPEEDNFLNYDIKRKWRPPFTNMVNAIHESKKGDLWCETQGLRGLCRFDMHTKTFTIDTVVENTVNGLSSNYTGRLMVDQNDALWLQFSEFGKSMQWIDKSSSKFTIYNKSTTALHNFSGGQVAAFAEAADSTFWLASEKGLYHWQPQFDTFTPLEFAKDYKEADINDVAIDKEGCVWFVVASKKAGGLYCYHPSTKEIKVYKNEAAFTNFLRMNMFQRIFIDRQGNVWIGDMNSGLSLFNKQTQKFTMYPYRDGVAAGNDTSVSPEGKELDSWSVQSIYEDKQGYLWIGTWFGGLNRFDKNPATFTYYAHKQPDLYDVVTMFTDHKNRLWAGTSASGVFVLDQKGNVISKYSEKNGLLYDGGWGMKEDGAGNIWIASPKGISILNPVTNEVKTITTEGGLPEDPAAYQLFKTSKGNFLYGCKDGFVELNPDDFAPDPGVPIVHIETVAFSKRKKTNNPQKDSSIVRYGKDMINLAYNENRVTFSYVGLLYQNTSLIKYTYKLDGYDKEWIQAGTNRSVTYTNLAPATYTFHVKASNPDGVWTIKDESVTILISSPWWRTWWAYLIYIAVLGLAIRWYVAYRSRSLRRHNRELEDKVIHRTGELREANDELKITQEKISAQRDELAGTLENLQAAQQQLIQAEKMASLGELTAGIAHEIQNPLNFVNNFSEVSAELAAEMEEALQNEHKEEAITIASDIRKNLQKINYHGKRADSIVKGMLQHSRTSTGKKEPADLNALVDEYLRLSYHGLRAKDKSFNASFHMHLDEHIGKTPVVPQDMGRVLLNLFNNAFYSVNEKKKQLNGTFDPSVWVSTNKKNNKVEISVKDNGTGIPRKEIDKIFQPFFTTKPTGQGTGLGLSISYDIITKMHGGELRVETTEGEGAEFVIQLPV